MIQLPSFCANFPNSAGNKATNPSKGGSVAAQCPLTIHPDGWVKHFTNFRHDGLSYSAVLRVCWKYLVLDRVLYPTNNLPTNPIKTRHPIHQPINNGPQGRCERSHLKVDTRFCTTVEKQFPKGRENTLKCQVGLKGLFWWGIYSTPPQSRAQPKNPSSSLPVTFLPPSRQSCTYFTRCTLGKLPKNISLDKVSSSEFIWLNSFGSIPNTPNSLHSHLYHVLFSSYSQKNQLPVFLSIPPHQSL